MGGQKHISVSAADLHLEDDGLVVVRVRSVDMTAEAMAAVLDARIAISDRRAPMLVDARAVRSMSREAQELTAAPRMVPYTKGIALLVGSPVSVVLVNFFMVFVKPPFPTKMFRDEDAARRWLASIPGEAT